MLSHLCFPLHTTPSEKAAADDVKCWGMYVKGTLWTSHWTPRSGHPDRLLQPGSSQTRVASVTKRNHPELATMINKMLMVLVKTVVSFTGWDIWVAVLTNIFSLSCCYLFFFFWACSSLYLLPVTWEHVTQKPMRWVTLKAPYELVRPQKGYTVKCFTLIFCLQWSWE